MDLSASSGISTLAQLYRFSGSASKFAVQHIDTLKQADSLLANRCGEVLEAATIGFGVGGETALVLIGAGQALLGNPLTAAAAVPAAGNPVVMTCAAIGAIHYGWQAMNEQERQIFLNAVSTAFGVGVEFIRSILRFAVDMINALMSRDNLLELKKLVRTAAAVFGRHLSDVTRAISDRVIEGARHFSTAASGAGAAVRAYLAKSSSPASPETAASTQGDHKS